MTHYISQTFWKFYHKLPEEIKKASHNSFELLKSDSSHPSLHFKKMNNYYNVRVSIDCRALGLKVENNTILWFWIGNHSDYEKIINKD
jgi:hypothetical protein